LASHLSFFGWCSVLEDSSSSPKANQILSQGKQNALCACCVTHPTQLYRTDIPFLSAFPSLA